MDKKSWIDWKTKLEFIGQGPVIYHPDWLEEPLWKPEIFLLNPIPVTTPSVQSTRQEELECLLGALTFITTFLTRPWHAQVANTNMLLPTKVLWSLISSVCIPVTPLKSEAITAGNKLPQPQPGQRDRSIQQPKPEQPIASSHSCKRFSKPAYIL